MSSKFKNLKLWLRRGGEDGDVADALSTKSPCSSAAVANCNVKAAAASGGALPGEI